MSAGASDEKKFTPVNFQFIGPTLTPAQLLGTTGATLSCESGGIMLLQKFTNVQSKSEESGRCRKYDGL